MNKQAGSSRAVGLTLAFAAALVCLSMWGATSRSQAARGRTDAGDLANYGEAAA
jgi:hypothetical protein